MKEVRYQINQDEVKEYCNCGSLLIEKHNFSHHYYDDLDDHTEFWVLKYLVCPACESLTVLLYTAQEDNSQYYETDEEKTENWLWRGYMRRVLYAPKKRLHSSVPYSISEVTNQAQLVFSASPRASFILCRAVLEEICTDFSIPTEKLRDNGKSFFLNLKDRLSLLFQKENLPEDLKSVMQGIRELGNEGAHSNHLSFEKQVIAEDAESLLMLVQYVIEKLYVDKDRQQEAMKILNQLKGKITGSQGT
jgi:hypothetical protein